MTLTQLTLTPNVDVNVKSVNGVRGQGQRQRVEDNVFEPETFRVRVNGRQPGCLA